MKYGTLIVLEVSFLAAVKQYYWSAVNSHVSKVESESGQIDQHRVVV
jgi:hypothetical protein